jgi:hypothetical protein
MSRSKLISAMLSAVVICGCHSTSTKPKTNPTAKADLGWCLYRPNDPQNGRTQLRLYTPDTWENPKSRKVRIFAAFDDAQKDKLWGYQIDDRVRIKSDNNGFELTHTRPKVKDPIAEMTLVEVAGKYLYGVTGGSDPTNDPLRHVYVFYHNDTFCKPAFPNKAIETCRYFSYEQFVDGDANYGIYRPDQVSDEVKFTYDAVNCTAPSENNGGSGGEPPP